MTTPTVPSLWGAGIEWSPEDTAGAAFTWQADDWNVGQTGKPHVFVSIAGRLVNGFGDDSVSLLSGSWSLGRNDWFDVLSSSNASFSFFGVVDAENGDEVVVSCEVGVLWVGNVNDRTETQETDGTFRTTITATDAVGRLGKSVIPTGTVVVGSDTFTLLFLQFLAPTDGAGDVIRYLLDEYGASDVALSVGNSVGVLPDLVDWYEPPDGLTLLEVLNTIERTANAMLALQPDGSLLLVMRDAIADSSVTINGDFETDTTGWVIFSSASVAQSVAESYTGTASMRITASTTAYSGARYAMTGTFKAGRAYRFSLAAMLISGTDGWQLGFLDGTSGFSESTDITVTGSWDTYSFDVTLTEDQSDLRVFVRHVDASAAVLAIDDVTVSAVVDVVDLSGIDAPYTWTKNTSATNIINHWVLRQPAYWNDTVLDETDDASVALYGDRAYSVDNFLCTTSTHFGSGLKAAMALPRPIVTNGSFHITDLSQQVLTLAPLSWVRQGDDTWQVMSVQHTFSGSSWDMSITADVSQNAMVGAADPDTDAPATATTTETQSLTSSKAATVFLGSSGQKYGNGAGDYLPVGRYSGTVTRALIGFTGYSIPSGFVRVKKATLGLRTSGQAWVAFGSKPKFYARRITESWTEGTFDAAAPNQYSASNASVWPGASATTSGQALKSIGTSENNDITVDVTDIVDAAFRNGTFHGIKLVSANEDSTTNTIEFWSDDTGTTARRPTLTIICEVEA